MKTKILIMGLSIGLLSGCLPMSEERAQRAVESSGMKDVVINRVPFAGCADDDLFQRTFEATDTKGRRVTGVVCGGWFKGATVRID